MHHHQGRVGDVSLSDEPDPPILGSLVPIPRYVFKIWANPHRLEALTLVPEPGRYSIVQEITQTVQGRSPDGDVPVQTTLLTVVYQLNERRSPSPVPSPSTASPVSIHDRYSLASCNVRFCGLCDPLSKGLTLFKQPGYMQDLPISPVSATFSENGDHVGSYLTSDCMGPLQETHYPHIPSLPVEDTFSHRWGGYVPPAAETLL